MTARRVAAALLLAPLAACGPPPDNFQACTAASRQTIAACTRVIEAPDQVPGVRGFAYVLRGNAYLDQRGDLARAMADYAAALALDPDDMHAYLNRAKAFQAAGDLVHAIADYDRVLTLLRASGKDPSVMFALIVADRGDAHLAQGDLGGAIVDYDAAIRILPRHARALYGRGLAKTRTGDQTGGEADMAAATAINSAVAKAFARFRAK